MDIQLWHLVAAVAVIIVPATVGYSKFMSERGEITMRVAHLEKDVEAANARISAQFLSLESLDEKLDNLRSDMQDMRVEILREIHRLEKRG